MSQVASPPLTIPRAEHLVIAIDDYAAMVDDVYAVVRFVPTRESVR